MKKQKCRQDVKLIFLRLWPQRCSALKLECKSEDEWSFFTLLKTYQVSKQAWDWHSGYFGYFFVTFCICLLLVISSLKTGVFGYFFKKWLFWLPFQRSGYFGYFFKEVATLATFSKKWLFWLFLVFSDNFWLLLASQNWLFRLIFRSKVL